MRFSIVALGIQSLLGPYLLAIGARVLNVSQNN